MQKIFNREHQPNSVKINQKLMTILLKDNSTIVILEDLILWPARKTCESDQVSSCELQHFCLSRLVSEFVLLTWSTEISIFLYCNFFSLSLYLKKSVFLTLFVSEESHTTLHCKKKKTFVLLQYLLFVAHSYWKASQYAFF